MQHYNFAHIIKSAPTFLRFYITDTEKAKPHIPKKLHFRIRKLWKTQVFNIFHIFSNRVCRIGNEPIFVENSALVENCVESLLKS